MAEQDPLKRLVERRHPDHKRHCAEWCFLRDAIEALPGDYAKAHLFKHPREADEVFERRKTRAGDHRYNLAREVIETYLGYLFQQPPTPAEGLPEAVTSFLDQADRDRRPALELAKDMAFWGQGYGIIWIGVDKPPLPPGTEGGGRARDADGQGRQLSAQQERDLGLAPYAYLAHPTHVLDGRITRGRIDWLLVQEDERDDADPLASTGEVEVRWRLWTPTEWQLIRKVKDGQRERYVIAEQGVNPVGEVPFVAVRLGKGTGFSCPGLVAQVAHLERAIFNHLSLVDEIHYGVTFPQLVYPYDEALYQTQTLDNGQQVSDLTPDGKMILTVGLHDVIPFRVPKDGGAAQRPDYITPSSAPAQELREAISEMVRLALALVALDGEIAPEGAQAKAAESGVARSYVFEKLNRRLATIADTLQAAFAKVFRLVCLWQGEDPEQLPPVPWDFPDQFQVESLAQELERLNLVLGGNPPSATMRAELWKQAAAKLLSKLDPQVLDQINAELDAGARAGTTGDIESLQAAGGEPVQRGPIERLLAAMPGVIEPLLAAIALPDRLEPEADAARS